MSIETLRIRLETATHLPPVLTYDPAGYVVRGGKFESDDGVQLLIASFDPPSLGGLIAHAPTDLRLLRALADAAKAQDHHQCDTAVSWCDSCGERGQWPDPHCVVCGDDSGWPCPVQLALDALEAAP